MGNENQIVLGVVTDSHVPERMKTIPASALQSFYQNDVPTILHAAQTLVAIIMGSIALILLFLSKKKQIN